MKETKKGNIVTSITIPKDVYEAVLDLASKEQRSLSNMISVILYDKTKNDTI